MPRISYAFFGVGTLCVLVGMIWGAQMGASGDHSMMPAHAHLNLLGFVTLSLMGIFYALNPAKANGRLAWINFGLSSVGVLVMIPMLAYLLADEAARGPTIGPLMAIPEVIAIAGMLAFMGNIYRSYRASKA